MTACLKEHKGLQTAYSRAQATSCHPLAPPLHCTVQNNISTKQPTVFNAKYTQQRKPNCNRLRSPWPLWTDVNKRKAGYVNLVVWYQCKRHQQHTTPHHNHVVQKELWNNSATNNVTSTYINNTNNEIQIHICLPLLIHCQLKPDSS